MAKEICKLCKRELDKEVCPVCKREIRISEENGKVVIVNHEGKFHYGNRDLVSMPNLCFGSGTPTKF